MSINDGDSEIIHLPNFWSTMAKVAIMLSVPATMALVTLQVWVVSSIFAYDTRITVLERMAVHKAMTPTGGGNSTATIITGDAGKPNPDPQSKGYLTTEEFAAKIDKDPRTVLSYITTGQISPPPVKDGREWRLAVNSRLQPLSTAEHP